MIGLHLHGFHHVAIELLFVEHHLHGPSAEHIGGSYHHGIANTRCHGTGLFFATRQSIPRLSNLEFAQDRLELLTVFSAIDRFRRGAKNACPRDTARFTVQPVQKR